MSAHDGKPATFGARSTALEVIAGHDLRGQEAIVTGLPRPPAIVWKMEPRARKLEAGGR